MAMHTEIARIRDGLLLAASMEVQRNLDPYKEQSKKIFRSLNPDSHRRLTIETSEGLAFHYIIENGVCYLCLCERSYPKRLAFLYLEEIQKEFDNLYKSQIETASRPYAFVKFDNYIQKTKKIYSDSRSIDKIKEDLTDVTRIMTQNIDEVLGIGNRLNEIHGKSERLVEDTAKYHKQTKYLNFVALWRQRGPLVCVSLMVLFMLWYRFM
eukprot:gnl/Hemi2/11387_TR3944_c0_g1_i1.p1 gnl/Hemi2/11387_TR3944_c0_g1~~gnl/Hemi2/11387_TR3944_c0_g1_i1.p1  ORF type:complete len:210 (+),score=59.52 gnl/Hemi2/11387_TR3944_c0_g1_i1:81-710(+)